MSETLLERSSLFFPESHCPDGLLYWPFPEFLMTGSRWSTHLRRMYRRAGICPPSVAPESGLLLQSLVFLTAPSTLVEIGSLRGVSAIWLAAGMAQLGGAGEPNDRRMHCIDLFGPPGKLSALDRVRSLGRRARLKRDVLAAGLGNFVRVHRGDSASILDRLRGAGSIGPGGRAIDLAYVDGDHTFEGVLRDIRALEPSLAENAVMILHDVFPERCGCDGPRRLLDQRRELLGDRFDCCDLYTMPCNFGLSVLKRKGSAPESRKGPPPDAVRLFLFSLILNSRPRNIALVGAGAVAELSAVTAAAAAMSVSTFEGESRMVVHAAGSSGGTPPNPQPRPIGWIDDRLLPSGGVELARHRDLASLLEAIDSDGGTDLLVSGLETGGTLPREFAEALSRVRPGGYVVMLRDQRSPEVRVELELAGIDACDLGGVVVERKRI